MRLLFRGLILLLITFSLISCKKTLIQEDLPSHIVVGNSYYTQVDMKYEKAYFLTTNYRRGTSIPVNTKVQVLGISSKVIELQVDSFTKPFLIKNAQKHTGDDIYQTFDKLLSTKKLNLRNYNSLERKYIKSGTVAKGMRKKAVIAAIGYPPMTKTMSLDVNGWVYWSGRYNTFRVKFKNGKVSSIVD